jgi:hypothetical protein
MKDIPDHVVENTSLLRKQIRPETVIVWFRQKEQFVVYPAFEYPLPMKQIRHETFTRVV